MKKLNFRSKSNSLKILKRFSNHEINVPIFGTFQKNNLQNNIDKYLKNIEKKFKKGKIIIRSSAMDEDQINISNAGKYDSFVCNVQKKKDLKKGLIFVLKKLKSPKDEVIFQKYISNPQVSGVIFTRDINTNAPYYVINYDKSGLTDLITSGKKHISQKTLNILKNTKKIPSKFKKLIKIIKKIEQIFNEDRLDIEFAIKNNKVFIFQVRNLKKNNKIDEKLFFSAITNLKKKIEKIKRKNPNLSGKSTILSNMADWNPAEMIGAKSTPLSFSLYSELITNEVWSKQRDNYGYYDVSPNRLMIDLAGSPYIDLRTDFNSFIPKEIPEHTREILINSFLNKIKKKNELHDKIEFSVIPTCLTLSSNNLIGKLLNKKNKSKYLYELKKLTENIVKGKQSPIYSDLSKILYFESQIKLYKKNDNNPIQNIFFIINLCKKYGTLPFAGMARCAFISTIILRELAENQIIDSKDLSNFYSSINTIALKFNNDLFKLKNKKISKKGFLNSYGHLRPSTYSISSKNYIEGYNVYFHNIKKIKRNRSSRETGVLAIDSNNFYYRAQVWNQKYYYQTPQE